ncbi:MAG TPA: hypothetical protein VJC18_04350, partial [bacterium]|nr:hypothetical protein [bacterium]
EADPSLIEQTTQQRTESTASATGTVAQEGSYYDESRGMKEAGESRSFNNFESNNILNIDDQSVASTELQPPANKKLKSFEAGVTKNDLNPVGLKSASSEAQASVTASGSQLTSV